MSWTTRKMFWRLHLCSQIQAALVQSSRFYLGPWVNHCSHNSFLLGSQNMWRLHRELHGLSQRSQRCKTGQKALRICDQLIFSYRYSCMPVALNLTKHQPVSQGLTSAKPPKNAGGGGRGRRWNTGNEIDQTQEVVCVHRYGRKKVRGAAENFPDVPEIART